MRIFLCGGGCGQQTVDANKKLNEVIDHNKPILYIPLAMPSERYPSCYEWIKDELKGIDVPNIDMVVSGTDLFNKNLENYSALFIGGGNTFKLLKDFNYINKIYDNLENKEFYKDYFDKINKYIEKR